MASVHAIILGFIQGATEFLPISSSAHLNILPWIFGWENLSEGMDAALHIGTLIALIMFFFKDWKRLILAGYNQIVKNKKTVDGKIFCYILVGTILAGILTLILDKVSNLIIGNNINLEMLTIACTLIIMGIILYIVDKNSKEEIDYNHISLKQSVLISISQALAAAFPGVSRSGITMTVARKLKLDRKSAAQLSFMLATPITLAAVIFKLNSFTFDLNLIFGILTSFVVGVISIKFLLNYLKNGNFKLFAIYRIIIGIIIFLIYFLR